MPEYVISRLQRWECDHATAEVQVWVPMLSDTLGVTRDGTMDDGVRFAFESPVFRVQIVLPFRPGAD